MGRRADQGRWRETSLRPALAAVTKHSLQGARARLPARAAHHGHEFLHPLAIGVAGIHRTLGILDHLVNPIELARTPALLAPCRQNVAVAEPELHHALVLVVGNESVGLFS